MTGKLLLARLLLFLISSHALNGRSSYFLPYVRATRRLEYLPPPINSHLYLPLHSIITIEEILPPLSPATGVIVSNGTMTLSFSDGLYVQLIHGNRQGGPFEVIISHDEGIAGVSCAAYVIELEQYDEKRFLGWRELHPSMFYVLSHSKTALSACSLNGYWISSFRMTEFTRRQNGTCNSVSYVSMLLIRLGFLPQKSLVSVTQRGEQGMARWWDERLRHDHRAPNGKV